MAVIADSPDGLIAAITDSPHGLIAAIAYSPDRAVPGRLRSARPAAMSENGETGARVLSIMRP
jgi:hypothetical protein